VQLDDPDLYIRPGRRRIAPIPRHPRQTHLEDDVVAIVRVARREEVCELGAQFRHSPRVRAPLRRTIVVGGQLASGLQIAAGASTCAGSSRSADLGESAADLAGPPSVSVQVRVGELALQVGMLCQQRINSRCASVITTSFPKRKPTPVLFGFDRSGAVRQLLVGVSLGGTGALAVALLEACDAAPLSRIFCLPV